MSTASINWEQYQQLPIDKRARPLTDGEYAALTKQQRIAAGLDEDDEGAPTNFAGAVFPNPDHIVPQLDTDNNVPVTRLPNGVTLQHDNYNGGAASDLSNPLPADIQPEALRTIGSKSNGPPMSAAPIDFSKYEAPASIDFSKYDGSQSSAPGMPLAPDAWGRLKQAYEGTLPILDYDTATLSGVGSIARGTAGAVKGAIDLFSPPKAGDEKAASLLGPPGLAVYRSLVAAGHTAKDSLQVAGALRDINESADPAGTYAKALQEMAGTGAGQALTALFTEGAMKGLPKAAQAVSDTASGVKPALSSAGKAATTVGASLDPDLVGMVSPRAAHALRWTAKVGKVATKLGAEAAPEAALDATADNVPYAGEKTPPRTLSDLGTPTLKKPPVKIVRASKSLGPNAQVLTQSQGLGQLTPPKTLADLANPAPPAAAAAPDPILAQLRSNAARIQAQTPTPVVPAGEGDLTGLLQKSLDLAKAKKSGVPTTASPSSLVKRWGVDEQSILDTDADVRGMTEAQSAKYLDKLVDSYKNGRKVDPVIETRDVDNNIISVDGRHRALAAQKAGVERIPIIVRRMKTLSALQ